MARRPSGLAAKTDRHTNTESGLQANSLQIWRVVTKLCFNTLWIHSHAGTLHRWLKFVQAPRLY